MPLKRSEYNAILSKNKKRQEFKEKLRKYTESYTNPKKITDTNETARFVEQTKPVQTGGSPALTVESNPAYINNMSGASARQTLAQNAPYGKVFDKDAFMRQQAISAVAPTTIRSSDNFTANALQRAANSAANNIAYANSLNKTGDEFSRVNDEYKTLYNSVNTLSDRAKSIENVEDKKHTLELLKSQREKMKEVGEKLDALAQENPDMWVKRNQDYYDKLQGYTLKDDQGAWRAYPQLLAEALETGVKNSTNSIMKPLQDFGSQFVSAEYWDQVGNELKNLVSGDVKGINEKSLTAAKVEKEDKEHALQAENEKRTEDMYKKYGESVAQHKLMQLPLSIAYSYGEALPYAAISAATGGVLGLSGAAQSGANAFSAAARQVPRYISYAMQARDKAKQHGTNEFLATAAGALEGANQTYGEEVLGGFMGTGTSLVGKYINVTNPLLKSGMNAAGAIIEEGLEEVGQDIFSAGIERMYNPDAQLDAKELLISGLAGSIMGVPGAVVSIPTHFRNYKSDVQLANSYINAVSSIQSEQDAESINQVGDNIKKQCDEWANEAKKIGGEAAEEAQKRAENIKQLIQNTQNTMDQNKESIIANNKDKKSALDNVVNNSKGDVVKNLANLVDEVSKGNNSGKNDYKATVDYILSQRDDAQAKYQQAVYTGDEESIKQYATDYAAYAEAARQFRNNQKEVQKARSSAEETKTVAAEGNTTTETTENAPKTTEKQESFTEKSDSIRETTMKDMGLLGVNKDIDTAADELVSKYGSYKNAVDAVIKAQDSVRQDATISDEEKQSRIHRLQDIDRSIRNRNTARMKSYTDALSERLKQYGVSGVKIMDVENDNVRNSTKVNGYYDPKTKTVYVSPYLDDARIAGAVAVHEFTHYGARADHSLVNDILKAKDTLVKSGTILEAMFDFAKYESAYTDEVSAYIASEDGRNEISALMQDGMTEDQAKAQASKDYVNEEIAAHFMQEILSKDDALDRLAKENRPLLKRIFDAIMNFFSSEDARNRRMAEIAADKIRAVLKDVEGVEVENSKKAKNNPQTIARENAEIGNTSTGRRFSLTHETEEAGDLIAVHNVNTEKLQKILKIGGLPMPSIAITKVDIGHNDFGDVSLVFSAETVDPSANKANKIYSADVYSPLFPSIEYEVNKDVANKIREKYMSIKENRGMDVARVLRPYSSANELELELNRRGGIDGLVEWLSNDTNMMNAFLADTGEEPIKTVVKEVRTELSQSQREMGQYLIETLGEDIVKEYAPKIGENAIAMRRRWFAEHEHQVRDVLKQYYTENGIDADTAQSLVDNTNNGEIVSSALKPAISILYGNADSVRTETDYIATQEKIAEAVKGDEYEAWLNELFDGVIKTEGIPNGKDPYTPTGNRRSFSTTHYPVTLDNIVKAMRGKGKVKGAETLTENARAIRSASADEFKSIADVKANENRLKAITKEEAKAQWDSFDQRLFNIINSMMDSIPKIDDRLREERRIGWVISEASRNPTTTNIRNMLQKYSANGKWFTFTEENISEIQSLVNDIRSAPSNIFESKPERVVSLDEIKYAVVPDTASKKIVTGLSDAGIPIKTYESGNEESRLETLNKLDGVRFSKDVDTETASRYDYSKSFAEQIDDYVNGKIPKYDTLVVGKTPEVFQEIGLTPLPMTYGTGHLKEVLNGTKKDHDFGVEVLKRVPEALESPVAIIASKTKPNSSIVAILDLSSKNKPLFAAVEIDGYGTLNKESIDSHAITSIHERKNASTLISDAIAHNRDDSISVFYVDKEKATRLLDASGVQFPGPTALPDGYVHSIHENGSPVKSKFQNVTQTKQFKHWFGNWDTHPEDASKVVNEDGTPKVVYHGTTANFTTFKPSDGALGKGIYFSDSKDFAKGYTYKDGAAVGTVMECYLDIKNPYIVKYADNYDTEALREKGYDGILHEATGMYVAFSPEQIKSATDNIGTFDPHNPDIRYSKDVFTPEEREKIISKGYTDYLARQFVVKDKSGEHAKAISISSRKKLAQQLAKPLKGVNASDALVAITPVFETIEKADGTAEQRAEKAYKAAEKAANDIIGMMKDVNTNTLYDQYAELRNYLRTTKLDTSSVKADIADYNDWRKSHMGSLKLGNDGMQIDTAYQELSGMYPEFFPANIENPADQLIHIGEISDNLKKVMDNPILSKEGSESVVRSFANAILAGYEEYAQETLGSQNSRMRDYVKTAAESIEQKNAQIKDAQEQLADTKADFRRFAETVQTAYETDVKHLNDQIQARDKSIARLEKYVSKTEKGAMEISRKKALSAFAKLQKTYEKPTTTNGVPENWKSIVSSMLNAFGNEDHAINAQTAIDQLAKMETLVSDSKRYDSKSVRVSPEQMENLSWQISGLRTFFENFSESQKTFGIDANNSVDIATSQNAAYIDSVRNLAETVNHLIRAENELFVGEKKAEASAIAYDFIDEIRERGKKFEKTGSESGPLKQWANSAVLDYTAPDVFLHNLGETGDQFAKAYREAQNKSTLLNQHYGEAMHSLVGDNYSADRTGIKGELIDVSINGENLKVSRQQLMSLYLLWKRPQARQHMEAGGVYFLNANGEQQGKPIVIHESEYRSLIGKLSSEDIRIADGIGKYLSETCAEWGNEASMKLYGYKKFNDPNYFPITVHGVKDQYHDEIYSVVNSLEHKSFTKHVDKNSVKALDIHDIFKVSDNHAKEMAQYSGFAPINSTFTRVYNAPGVQTALLEQYGRRAIGYMNDFLDRANGKPVGKDTKATDMSQKFASMAKKAAVGFNVSTAMKQPISYIRAAPELDMDVFAKAGAEIFKPSRYNTLYNEMVTNSGIARIKALGFSDVGIGKEARGNYSDLSFSSAYNKGKFVKSKFEDASMWLAGKADEITWVRIWDACKMQIDKENAKLSSEKRIQLTTEKFNQIVGRTQVVDSVLDSAPASYNSVFKILHPFMNETMKTVSSLWYAYEEMKKGVPGGKQKFVKQIAATAASNLILEPLIASVIGALRDKEDEDPEKFAEKVLNKMSGISLDSEEPTSFRSVATSEIVSGIAFAPMASFFYSIFTDVLNGFEGDSMNSANLYEFMKSSVKLTEALMKGEDYSGQKSIYNLAAECATSMAQAFGIPANTMRQGLNAALRTALYYTQDIVPMNNIVRWKMNKLYYNLGNKSARTEKYFYDILIDAYNQEDKTAYNIMREDLDEMGIQSKEIVEIIEKRNGAIKPGSSVWNTELQARFDLPTKSTSSQVEQMVTRVYAACQKIDALDESKVLPKRPDKYSYTDSHGDKVEMSTQEYDKFVEDVGVLRYKLCAELASSNAWSKLSTEQQLYGITKAYDFAARYYRRQFNAEYDSGDTWMKELYGKQLRIKDVATTIISKAFKK